MNALSPEEQQRYARQIGLGVLTLEQQERLKSATVLVTRVGGMGGPAAQMLVMAGVGRVIIAHGGSLISPDLNRQVLGAEAVLGLARAPHFAEYLRSLNRFVEVEAIAHEPDDAEAEELAERSDVLLSCPPTFEERLRLNRAARAARQAVGRCGPMGHDRHVDGAPAAPHRLSAMRLPPGSAIRGAFPRGWRHLLGDRFPGRVGGH